MSVPSQDLTATPELKEQQDQKETKETKDFFDVIENRHKPLLLN